MKKIIVIKGNSQYGTLRVGTDDLVREFRELGINVTVVDRQNEDDWKNLPNILDASYDAVFSMQMVALKAKILVEKCKGDSFKNIKYICICADHPLYANYWLKQVKDKNSFCMLLADRNHKKYIDEFYPNIKTIVHGTTIGSALSEIKAYKSRTIDVFFGGTYFDVENEWENIEQLEDADKVIAKKVIPIILDNTGMTLEAAVKSIVSEYDIEEFRELMERLMPVDRYIRGFYRNEWLMALARAGIKLSIFGNGWDKSLVKTCENVTVIEGEATLEQGMYYMADSKMILNIMPWSRNGLHDRIINAMLVGAICVTNSNERVNELFSDKEIVAYPLDQIENVIARVKYLLANEEEAEKISALALKRAHKDFSVQKYAQRIVECIDEVTER